MTSARLKTIPLLAVAMAVAMAVVGCGQAVPVPGPTTTAVGSTTGGSVSTSNGASSGQPPVSRTTSTGASSGQPPVSRTTSTGASSGQPPTSSRPITSAATNTTPVSRTSPATVSGPASTPGTSTASASSPQVSAAFQGSINPIDAALAGRMRSTYRSGCPVPLAELRYLRLSFHGFDGQRHPGELVVSAAVAGEVLEVFRKLYEQKFSIRSMRLVDDFGGSDDASMAADNTSAFNCRRITGGSSWSEHSYGDAVDINPRENPYLFGGTVLPPAGAPFVDRPRSPGVIHPDDLVVRAFSAIGWTWGGSWSSPVDLQHFSRSGR